MGAFSERLNPIKLPDLIIFFNAHDFEVFKNSEENDVIDHSHGPRLILNLKFN